LCENATTKNLIKINNFVVVVVVVVIKKEESAYFNNKFELIKVDRHIKNLKSKKTKDDVEQEVEEDMLKGLSFNVHINATDMEAKKNLILPYEILG
jgi:hypothetical protein